MNWYFDRLSSRLNKKATIKHMVTSQERDKLGQYPVVEETVAKVWSGVTPQTGSLLSGRAAETAISRTTHKVTIRYRKGLTEDMWLEIEGETYDILYILDPYMRHEWLEIFCEVRIRGNQRGNGHP